MYKRINSSQLKKLLLSKANFKLVDIHTKDEKDYLLMPKSIHLHKNLIESKVPEILHQGDLIVLCNPESNHSIINEAAEKLLSMGYRHIITYYGKIIVKKKQE